MTVVLRKSVMVAGTPGRPLRQLNGGTPLDEIAEADLAQLHPDHFIDVGEGEPGQRPPTGDDSFKAELGPRLSKLAEDLRALDGTAGVDSTQHVDDPSAWDDSPDHVRQAQLAYRAGEVQAEMAEPEPDAAPKGRGR